MMHKTLIGLMLLATASVAMALEKPDYDVVLAAEEFEVRNYGEYMVAKVDVPGAMTDAGNSAFRILAGYIFGKNATGEKMNMTAPVESQNTGTGNATYAFVMERKYSLATLPAPADSRIRITHNPQRVMAVRKYSGTWSEANYRKHHAALLAALAAAGIEAKGDAIWARYNSPFTPWFLRHNEIMIEIDWPAEAETDRQANSRVPDQSA